MRRGLSALVVVAVLLAWTGGVMGYGGNGVAAAGAKTPWPDKPDKDWVLGKGCPRITLILAQKPGKKEKLHPKCVNTPEEADAFQAAAGVFQLAELYENVNYNAQPAPCGTGVWGVPDCPRRARIEFYVSSSIYDPVYCEGLWTNIWGDPYYFNDVTSSLHNSCDGIELYWDGDLGTAGGVYPPVTIGFDPCCGSGPGSYVGNYMNDRASSVRMRGWTR